MIASFSFSNFKSIKEEVTLSLEASKSTDLEDYYVVQATPKLRLLKMAAIYGPNASGKSNVLEALDFLRRLVLYPKAKKTERLDYDRFLFEKRYQSSPTQFKLTFVQSGVRYDYELMLTPDSIQHEVLYFYDPNKAVVYNRNTEGGTNISNVEFGSKVRVDAESRKILEAHTLPNNTVLGAFLKVNLDIPILSGVMNWFRATTDLVTPQDKLFDFISDGIERGVVDKELILTILRKADFNIRDFSFETRDLSNSSLDSYKNGTPPIHVLARKLRTLNLNANDVIFSHSVINDAGDKTHHLMPLEMQSVGTQRFFQFAGLLERMINDNLMVAIDEIEDSLHPDLLKQFLLMFLRNSRGSQLIFTTHQRDLMQETEILRKDSFHFTEKGIDGSTELFSLADFNTSVIRKGSSLYNTYKSGKLGATPELEDAYIPMD